MRRLTFMTLVLVVAFAGCGETADNNDNANNTSANNTSPNNTSPNNTSPNNTGNNTNSDIEACAGSYLGTFTGDDTGALAATLDADGTITLTFTTSVGEVSATGEVTETGAVSGSKDDTTVTGTMDFSDCSMSGDWETTGFGEGAWTASKS